jgi:hypothetical protein
MVTRTLVQPMVSQAQKVKMMRANTRVEELLRQEREAFGEARRIGEVSAAWAALEREHIIGQPYLAAHFRCHLSMLGFAIELRDWKELRGQILRLLLAPLGNASGRLPVGNTGRSNVSAFAPMEIPADLSAKIENTSPDAGDNVQ